MNFEKLPQDERMGSPQESEAVLWGKKSWSKAGQKLVKRWTKGGQKMDKRWTNDSSRLTANS